MRVRKLKHQYMGNIEPFLHQQGRLDAMATARLLGALEGRGLSLSKLADDADRELAASIAALAQNGFLELASDCEELTLTPCSRDFLFGPIAPLSEGSWKLSCFTYSQLEGEAIVVRSPLADCFSTLRSDATLALVHGFRKPVAIASLLDRSASPEQTAELCGALARAGVILRCDADGKTLDDLDAARRQWGFHDLLFHSLSRLGRTEKEIGGTYRFKGKLPPPPAVKTHPWTEQVIPLPRANIEALIYQDMSLTAAIETRQSTRKHAIVPLSKQELGELLFRTVRVRHQFSNAYGDFTSRPYPGGGACYENEFYLTIDACIDIERGFYYYDPVAHALCLVSKPSPDTDALLDEAYLATAMQCRPQVLLTIASRFNRFNWKYASMSYAAQLKNVGVIYQTLYLVATAMKIGACALGMGNTERFARITGLDYLEEGSVGEFMLGRPL